MTAASYSRVLGANDAVQMGVIGVGDRGRHVMSVFMNNPEVHVSAVCDVYAQQIDLAKQKATAADVLLRLPQVARNEGPGHRPHCHARPLAR